MNDPFVEVMDPLRILRERIEATLAEHGLRAAHIGIVPGATTDGPHEVQILAILAGDKPQGPDEFERVVQEAREADIDQRNAKALEALRRNLRGGSGFLEPPE